MSRFKPLDPREMLAAIDEVGRLAKHARIRVAIGGGMAMQVYGSDRLTKDVDFLAEDHIQLPVRLAALSFGGVTGCASNGVCVDIIVRNDDYAPLYAEALEEASYDEELGAYVVSAEHLVAMKMSAGRAKDELDLQFLLGEEGLVNMKHAEEIVRRHLGVYAVQELRALVAEAKWRKEQEGK